MLPLEARVLDRAADGIAQIDLPFDRPAPRRRVRILEISHVHLRARVERVDHHLAIDRPGDFDAPIDQVARDRRDAPFGLAHVGRVLEELRERTGIEIGLALSAVIQQVAAAVLEGAREIGDKAKCGGCEDFSERRRDACKYPRTRLRGSPRRRLDLSRWHVPARRFRQVLCLRAPQPEAGGRGCQTPQGSSY